MQIHTHMKYTGAGLTRACVRACVRARVRARVRACVRAYLLAGARIIYAFCSPLFSHLPVLEEGGGTSISSFSFFFLFFPLLPVLDELEEKGAPSTHHIQAAHEFTPVFPLHLFPLF